MSITHVKMLTTWFVFVNKTHYLAFINFNNFLALAIAKWVFIFV